MSTLSKYTHVIRLDEKVGVLWNALRMRAIFLSEPLLTYMEKIPPEIAIDNFIGQFPENLAAEAENLNRQMAEQKFWVNPEDEEQKLLEIRSHLDRLPIGIMYLILSNRCNLRCRYCYLTKAIRNNQSHGRNMTLETIKSAVDLFREITDTNGVKDPEMLFYGGEPLLNLKGLLFALEYAHQTMPNCQFTLNTNGTLITEAIAQVLKQYNVTVSVSLDGPKEINDLERVDRNGAGSFDKVIAGIKTLQKYGVQMSLSCTISPLNMVNLKETLIWFIDDLKVEGVDFNLMLGDFGNDELRNQYAVAASKILVECYQLAKSKGILIDRMMRIVRPLAKGTANFNSCAGCGQQIVVTPDGQVGVCQGNLNTMEDFIPLGKVVDITNHPLWTKWRERSPFNIDRCLECEALAVCGGGCPYSARLVSGDIMSLDTIHCAFAKEALTSLLREIWDKKKSKSMV